MAKKSELGKYLRKSGSTRKNPDPEVTANGISMKSDAGFGNLNFALGCRAITKPFYMVKTCHYHDFDQFLLFTGGDGTNMSDLGGVVELTLSKDGKKLEKFTITQATSVYIPAGMYHCPLNFKKVNDPKKPIIFHNLFFSNKYKKSHKK